MEILNSLLQHCRREKVSFHMPGHKNGAAFLGTRFENEWLKMDVTELAGTDALSHPHDAILKSQQYAAALYGAARAFYLVNGSSCGILSMIYAYFREGDQVLVDRAAHRSVGNAFALCGAVPVYLAPQIDKGYGVPRGITAVQVRQALEKTPNIKGIFITSPNYYGFVSEIKEIACMAHEKGIPLLVDEAHGAHFPFDSRFPENAIRQGADAAVVSMHKSLPCPNQTALLLLREANMEQTIFEAVNIFQTTSPSYILLAYMEAALDFAVKNGKQRTDLLLEQTKPFERYRMQDPFKLLLSFEEYGLSGYNAERFLREKYGIYAEMADERNVLLMTSWGNRAEDFRLLSAALADICASEKQLDTGEAQEYFFPEGAAALSPRAVRKREHQWVSVSEAIGKICAGSVTAFPPCIPILLPGERITERQMQVVINLLQSGRTVDGVENGKICIAKEM